MVNSLELMIVVLLKDIRFENNSAYGRFGSQALILLAASSEISTWLVFFLAGSRNCGFLRCAFPIDIFTRVQEWMEVVKTRLFGTGLRQTATREAQPSKKPTWTEKS